MGGTRLLGKVGREVPFEWVGMNSLDEIRKQSPRKTNRKKSQVLNSLFLSHIYFAHFKTT